MIGRGRQNLTAKRYKDALADFQAANVLPENLSEATGGAAQARQTEINYWIGVAYDLMGDKDKARQSWQASAGVAADGDITAPAGGRGSMGGRGGFGGGRGRRGGGLGAGVRVTEANTYYQAMSLQKLGEADHAKAMFQQMIDNGTQSLNGATEIQSPATSAQRATVADAHYMVGLGQLGLNDKEKAKQEFSLALQASPDHIAAKMAITEISP